MTTKYPGIGTGTYAEQAIDIVASEKAITGATLSAAIGITTYEIGALRKAIALNYLHKARSTEPGKGNVNIYSIGAALTPELQAAALADPSSPKFKCTVLPTAGSRQRRVIDELYRHSQSVPEGALMNVHGLDGLAPTMWRQGPYKALSADGLIRRVAGGFQDTVRWALTRKARELMDEEYVDPEKFAPPPAIVQPREAPVFRPLNLAKLGTSPQREGAWDFRSIPSRYTVNKCA